MTTTLLPNQITVLLSTLKSRFEKNHARHPNLSWDKIEAKLRSNNDKLWSLSEMERTGGEPDVIEQDDKTRGHLFVDCSVESPKGRRSLCYDHAAWAARKVAKPTGSAIDLADSMGIKILNEDQYRHLQTLGEFDQKTSSWLLTPENVRKLGGAIYGDRRYNHIFIYHNGADSYYAARGFRGCLIV